MGVVHVAAFRHVAEVLGFNRPEGGFLMMGTWVDLRQEQGPWQSELGKPTYHHDFVYHWAGATYTIEYLSPRLIPWLVNTRREHR